MANRQNTLLLKRSNIIGKIPPLSGLTLGEMALNTADAKLYSLYTSGSPSPSEVRQIGWDRISRTGDTVFGDFEISGSSLPSGYALSVTGDTNFVGDILVEGNVGIGTISPREKLDVSGNTIITGNLTVSGITGTTWFSGNSSSDLVRVTQTGSGNAFVVEDSNNPDSTPFRIDASGNTAIGVTTSPLSFKLEVNGTSMFRNNMFLNGGVFSETYTYNSFTDSNKVNLSVGRFHDHNDGAVDQGYTSQFRWDKRQSSNISLARSIDIPVNFTSGSSGTVGQFNSINTFLQILEGSTVTTPFVAHAVSATKGTTGTVTSFTGFDVQDNSVSNTTYGFRSRLTSGSGKYGLYFDGTANNYFNGNVGIGTLTPREKLDVSGNTIITGNLTVSGITGTTWFSGNSSSDLVRVTQTGSGNAFVVEDNTNPDSSPFVIDVSGNTGIGTLTPQARLDVRAQGNLSTDIVFRVRNSGDTGNLFAVRGDSNIVIGDETLVDRDIIYLSNRFIRFQEKGLNVTNWFASAPPVDVLSSHKFGFNNNSLFEFKGDSSLHIGLPGINQFSMALRVNSTQNILEGFRNAFGTNVKELRIRTGEPFTTGGIPYNSGNIVLQTGSGFNGGLNGDIIFQISSGLTEVSRITSTGLGIGTSTPREKLDVSGNTIISSGLSASTVTITTQPTSGYTSTQILMRNSTSGQVEITNSTSPSIYNYGMSYAMTTFNYLT